MIKPVNFGYKEVVPEEKTRLVRNVFTSVATDYDLMNDVMSFGIHRLWKRYVIYHCAIRKNHHVLDLAGGTGDLSRLIHKQLGLEGSVTLCDINEDMLIRGRNRCIDKGIIKNINYVQANAESLPFAENSFDCIVISFGLRNITDKSKALSSMHDKLKFGSKLVILEFSKVIIPLLDKLYEKYSFHCIPLFGQIISGNKSSYQYLVESIKMHPNQERLAEMMQQVGFNRVSYQNLLGGVVAVHTAYKL